jgi:hypothetical protein
VVGCWFGHYNADGSGIAYYGIYVSANEAASQLFLKRTTPTSRVFTSVDGRTNTLDTGMTQEQATLGFVKPPEHLLQKMDADHRTFVDRSAFDDQPVPTGRKETAAVTRAGRAWAGGSK